MSSFFEYDNIKKWWDAFAKLPKRKKIPIVFIILIGIATLIWWNQHRISQKNEVISSLRFENEKLQRENLHLKEIINPIEQKAKELFPELETSAAMAKISEDIEKVRALATRDIYQPLNPELRTKIINTLKTLHSKYSQSNPRIKVGVEKGNKNRELLSVELIEILIEADFRAEKMPSYIIVTSGPQADIAIKFNPESIGFAQELVSILNLFINTQFYGSKGKKLGKNTFEVYIDGTPQFLPNGSVAF